MSMKKAQPKTFGPWWPLIPCLAAISAAAAVAEVDVSVRDHGRPERGVESVIISLQGDTDSEEGATDPAGALTLQRDCISEETLRARPSDVWYYRSGREECSESVILAVKKHRTELRARGGRNSPVHVNLGFALLLGDRVDLELGNIVWDREFGEETPRWAGGVALNFHPFPDGRVDVYGGPVVSYLTGRRVLALPGRNADSNVPIELVVEDEAVVGFNLGVDLPLRAKGVAFNVAFQYLPTSPSVRTAPSVFLLPEADDKLMVGSVGLSWRF